MRKAVIGVALAATLVAAWFAPDEDSAVISTASARSGQVSAVAPSAVAPPAALPLAGGAELAPGPMLEIAARLPEDDLGNAFAKQTWQQPAMSKQAMMEQSAQQEAQAAPVAKTAAGKPGAPALPISFLGRFVDEGKTAYFLQVDERNIVARMGDTIETHYRLDSEAGGTLTFTYLPLNQKQELAVGESN